ncbi:hypothetical protein BDP81DRAFT_413518 [Colletotrichum phormii]|uniref:Uncharacterized protein n=1 Tax=Colletotrichum phormii TaxID=359342 RepID=A0AAJ0A497_9PEZI|nr:uncharacterized protein BDP81DRAFT_413518 [Colletotrichum phormii]KAK1655814.1 hypothetical protein BDP81DRAFT_413518 [Colletotrichum phormii]
MIYPGGLLGDDVLPRSISYWTPRAALRACVRQRHLFLLPTGTCLGGEGSGTKHLGMLADDRARGRASELSVGRTSQDVASFCGGMGGMFGYVVAYSFFRECSVSFETPQHGACSGWELGIVQPFSPCVPRGPGFQGKEFHVLLPLFMRRYMST